MTKVMTGGGGGGGEVVVNTEHAPYRTYNGDHNYIFSFIKVFWVP